jgi:hypothetical protein
MLGAHDACADDTNREAQRTSLHAEARLDS